MTEPDRGKLKVVSSGSQDPDVVPVKHIVGFVLLVAVMIMALRNGPEHLWRSIGPGSSSYRACFALLEENVENFDLRAVHAQQFGDNWSFHFEIDLLTADNSPGGDDVYRCNGRDGDVSLEGF